MKLYVKGSDDVYESEFHVSGHTDNGYFIEQHFDTLEDAIEFFDSQDWQDADLIEERFLGNKREYITHRYI